MRLGTWGVMAAAAVVCAGSAGGLSAPPATKIRAFLPVGCGEQETPMADGVANFELVPDGFGGGEFRAHVHVHKLQANTAYSMEFRFFDEFENFGGPTKVDFTTNGGGNANVFVEGASPIISDDILLIVYRDFDGDGAATEDDPGTPLVSEDERFCAGMSDPS